MNSPFEVSQIDPVLESDMRSGLEAVETLLRDTVKSDFPLLNSSARHLAEAGGKRFRPLLVLLTAQFGDPDAPGVVPAAVVVELTHLGTLYHDDVMDEATLRRGAPSANSRWDNSVAILTGDFLFARASDLLADLGADAVRIQARTFERLVSGQIRETVGPADGEDAIGHYLTVVADKTGSLFSTCSRFGALLSGAPEPTVDLLTQFGERIGIAFQLADDVLDVASDSADLGKTPGTDLREGIATLPVLYMLAANDSADERLRMLLAGGLRDDGEHAEALELLRAHPAMGQARADARRWADDARAVLAPLPHIPARRALEALCDLVVSRTG
ncbi:MAG: polyprenyl synthetase family protein [Sporichthyaceae bacterium]|nr:polyprenyl synthetase family protein [Sporichthyaceae bacterium]